MQNVVELETFFAGFGVGVENWGLEYWGRAVEAKGRGGFVGEETRQHAQFPGSETEFDGEFSKGLEGIVSRCFFF